MAGSPRKRADRAGREAQPAFERGKLVMESAPGPVTVLDGREYLYFGGTGYLGLQGHPALCRAACQAMKRFGLASATSRARMGNNPPTLDAERAAAEFFGAEASFYYASGYASTLIFLQAFGEQFDAVFVDERSHYSILEAAHLAGKPVRRFAHLDATALAAALATALRRRQRPLVMTDGVFASAGAIAPVKDYHAVLRKYPGAAIFLDDAHAIGVLGDHGRGTFEHAGFRPHEVNTFDRGSGGVGLFFAGTLSKAVGGFGGIFPGTEELVARLKTHSHFYDGASQPPVPAAAATACALRLVMGRPALRLRLHENTRIFKAGLRKLGLGADDTPVPIIGLDLGSAANMRRIEDALRRRGIILPYVARYAGVGRQGLMRAVIFATHTRAMIEHLLGELARLL